MQRQRLVLVPGNDRKPTSDEPADVTERRTELTTFDLVEQGVGGDEGIVPARFEDVEATAGSEHARAFVDAPFGFVEVVDDVAHEDVIEGCVFEGQLERGAGYEA